MGEYYKLHGLLFVFMNCFMLASSAMTFVEEPKTDKSCYVPNENGILTTTVSMQDLPASEPLDRYTIAWSWNPNEDGTTWFLHDMNCKSSSIKDPTRWKGTMDYRFSDNIIYYTMEVKDMIFQDETAGLYAFVIDLRTDLIVARSSCKARFNVNLDCPVPIPTNDIPLTKEADPDPTSSTHTSSSSPSPSSFQKWSSEIIFVDEPKTDKSCYIPNEKGILTTKVYITADHASIPYGRYIISWSSNPNEDGTTWLIYDINMMTLRIRDPTRWKTEVGHGDNFIKYKLEVKDMIFQDETAGLYAFVIDRRTDLIVARSSAKARFNVNLDCSIPTNDIPLTKEADPDPTSSTHTSSSSPSPSVGSYLSQIWSIISSDMEETISCFTTGQFLVAAFTLLCTIIGTIIGIMHRAFRDIQFFFPDVYDFTREWFRRLWRRVLQFLEHRTPEENDALNNDPIDSD